MDDFILEEKIRETLKRKADSVHVDTLDRQRIRTEVYQRLEEENRMKHRNWKKTIVVAAAICVLGSITAMALGKASVSVSHSSNNEAVTSYSQAVTMQNGYDKSVKSVENFSNGYNFAQAVPTYGEERDDNGNVLSKNTYMSFTYQKNGLDNVMLNGHRSTMPDGGKVDRTMTLDNGVELKYSKMRNKFVPVDYTPTEEDLRLSEEGSLNLAYGSDEVEEINSSSVLWEEGGITYILFTFENSLSGDEMLQMAKEVVESK